MSAKSAALSVDRAWNTVALEERVELISKSQAQGLTAGLVFCLFMGCIAYGFDEILLLPVAFAGALIITPLFSSQRWRREKPQLILQYLAARSVARRYGYGCSIPDLDIVLIFRGTMRELFSGEGDEMERLMSSELEYESGDPRRERDVWICLMQGGIVIMSERVGGAKLDFSAAFSPEFSYEDPSDIEDAPRYSIILNGTGISKDKRVFVSSHSVAAMYVFHQKVKVLVEEGLRERQKLIEQIAKSSR